MPARKKTRRRKNPVRPGELFVIVDVSSPGGTWDGQIYRGSAKADREAAKRKGQRVQVIDAMWYTPARNVLETSGLIARTRKNPRINTKKGYMKVNARISHWLGDLYLEPVSQKACTAYSKHMEEMTGHYGCTAYIQNSWEVDSFIAEYVPPSKRRDLREGWDATFLMDPWIFGHVLGYDAHNVSW